jgi:TonB-dependent receptor
MIKLSHPTIAVAVLAVLSQPNAAQAQAAPAPTATTVATADAGGLQGQIQEKLSGVALSGAVISIGGQQTRTDSLGQFRVSGLAPGEYTLTVDFLGYQRQVSRVTIRRGEVARADITMTASSDPTAATADAEPQLIEVRSLRDAQALALNQQRGSINYVNIVSADFLGRFPDNNIAESTQRIPGVSIERDQGEGRYVTVRGAPKEYTTVSLNGVPLANPDQASRGVELDTIPADVISVLEVTKALTPDMDGDAIAGNINIRTQSAFDRRGATLRASVGAGRFELGPGINQRSALTVGQRFGADQNIGLLFSGSQSKQGRFTDNAENVFGSSGGRILPLESQIKDYEGKRTRTGLSGRLDVRFDANNQISFIASDARFQDHEFRDNLYTTFSNHTAASNETLGEARATFDKELRERTYNKSIRTFNLNGEHWLNGWKANWQASRSQAKKVTEPRDQFIFRSTVTPNVSYDYANPDFPVWKVLGRTDTPTIGLVLPESWFAFRRYNDRYELNKEKEDALRLDLQHGQNWLGADEGQVQIGLRLRFRDKSFDDERFRNSSPSDFAKTGVTMSNMLCSDLGPSDNFNYFFTGRRFCRDIFQKYGGPLVSSSNNLRLIPDSISGDYKASEDIQAGYLRLDSRWGALSLITGLRYERTEAKGSANQFNSTTSAVQLKEVSRSYSHVLPSVHLRQTIGPDRVLRASYSTALSRPDFIYTAPYRIFGESETSPVTEGNPQVKAAFANNLDLSFEQYLRPLGLISAALFYKQIKDPLFVASRSERLPSGASRLITRPENGDGGRIHGLELAWQQRFDTLPAPFNGLGAYTNYTYAKSSADLPFGLGKTELPGTSRQNYNVAVSYEAHGLNSRLAYNYRSKYIQQFDVSNPLLNIYWNDRASVDFSAAYFISKQWSLFLEGNNLTDTRQVRFQGTRNRVLELEAFGPSWLAGVKFQY